MSPGDVLEPQSFRVTRADLVAYAEAGGDHNPIHQDDEAARAVGLPGVIAHGMYTLALVGRALDAWAGEPGRVVELTAKFTKPVVVDADDGATVHVSGTVASADQDTDGSLVTLNLEVTSGGEKVLGRPMARIRG